MHFLQSVFFPEHRKLRSVAMDKDSRQKQHYKFMAIAINFSTEMTELGKDCLAHKEITVLKVPAHIYYFPLFILVSC